MSKRIYEQNLPEVDEYVVGSISKIENDKYHVNLLEYDVMAVLSLNNYSRKMLKMIRKKLKKNNEYVFEVIMIDNDKGYVDLSRNHITDEIEKDVYEKYKKVRKFTNVMNHVCDETVNQVGIQNMNNLQNTEFWDIINELIIWPYYEQYDNPSDGIKEIEKKCNDFIDYVKEIDELKVRFDNTITDILYNIVESDIKKHFAPKIYKLRTGIEITCFEFEGIDAIKSTIDYAITNIDQDDVSINIDSIPNYNIEFRTYDFVYGDEQIKKFINLLDEYSKKNKNGVNIKLISDTSVISSSGTW